MKKKEHLENKFKLQFITITATTKKRVVEKKIRIAQGCLVFKNF